MRINEDFIDQSLTSDDIVSQNQEDIKIKREAPLLLYIFITNLPGSMTTDKKINAKFETFSRLLVKRLHSLRIISYVKDESLKNINAKYSSTSTKIVEINFDAQTDTPLKVRRLMVSLYKTIHTLYKKVFRSTGKINILRVGKGEQISSDVPFVTEKNIHEWETINNIEDQVDAFCFFNEDYAEDAARYWIRNLKNAFDKKDVNAKLKTEVCNLVINNMCIVKKIDRVEYRDGTVYLYLNGPLKIHSAAYVLGRIKEILERTERQQIDPKLTKDTKFKFDDITKLTFDIASITNDWTQKLDFSWVREFLENYVGDNVREIVINQNEYCPNWWFTKKYENKTIDLTKELKGYNVTWTCSKR